MGLKIQIFSLVIDKYDEITGFDDAANFSHGLWGEIDYPLY